MISVDVRIGTLTTNKTDKSHPGPAKPHSQHSVPFMETLLKSRMIGTLQLITSLTEI